ncbi:MAG: trypsin-like peptidase domain-containing protein [Pseudomonadota bacterium]
MGEDTRRLSLFPYVANVGAGDNSLASAVVVGRRHLITAAHLFVGNGRWLATGIAREPVASELSRYRVFIEGCPNRTYAISDVHVNTLNPEINRASDYAVVQIAEPHCGVSVPIWSMTRDDVDAFLLSPSGTVDRRDVTVAGYYGPHTVALYSESASLDTGKFENLEFDLSLAWQYAAEGPIVEQGTGRELRLEPNNRQRLFAHEIDTDVGSSGGPLLVRDGDEVYAIGIQIGERRDDVDLNYAISISDDFLDMIVEHVPDAVFR